MDQDLKLYHFLKGQALWAQNELQKLKVPNFEEAISVADRLVDYKDFPKVPGASGGSYPPKKDKKQFQPKDDGKSKGKESLLAVNRVGQGSPHLVKVPAKVRETPSQRLTREGMGVSSVEAQIIGRENVCSGRG